MNTEELVSAMKSLVHCYEEMNNPEGEISKEINSWRERFLKEHATYNDKNKENAVRMYFMGLPSDVLNRKSFELHLKDCESAYEQNKELWSR